MFYLISHCHMWGEDLPTSLQYFDFSIKGSAQYLRSCFKNNQVFRAFIFLTSSKRLKHNETWGKNVLFLLSLLTFFSRYTGSNNNVSIAA